MKATKKLIGASIALVAAAALTVGSTFAWFSYQSKVGLEKVEFSVDSSDENLQVAVTKVGGVYNTDFFDSDFTYSLKTKSIKDAINGGTAISYKPLTVEEDDAANNTVTSANQIVLHEEDDPSTEASTDSYAAFDLVFRYTPYKTSEGKPSTAITSLILDYGSKVTAEDLLPAAAADTAYVAWENFDATRYGQARNENDPLNARARDAARVAFLWGDSTKTNKVWSPSETFGGGVSTTQTSDVVKGFYNGNLASDYNMRHKVGYTAVTAPTYASRVYAGIQTPATASAFDYSKITEFPALSGEGAIHCELRLTVKVWLEGKDGDCIESIRNDKFAFTLKFRTSTLSTASS